MSALVGAVLAYCVAIAASRASCGPRWRSRSSRVRPGPRRGCAFTRRSERCSGIRRCLSSIWSRRSRSSTPAAAILAVPTIRLMQWAMTPRSAVSLPADPEGAAVVRRRRKLARRLTTADMPKRQKKHRSHSTVALRTGPQRQPETEESTEAATGASPARPRMRPKKTVGERLRPDEASNPRPIVRLRVVGVFAIALFALMLIRLWYLQVLDASCGEPVRS